MQNKEVLKIDKKTIKIKLLEINRDTNWLISKLRISRSYYYDILNKTTISQTTQKEWLQRIEKILEEAENERINQRIE